MCSFEKRDLYIMGVQVEGITDSLVLNLRASFDKRSYSDYFTIDRLVGRAYETVFTIPFKDIEDITYEGYLSGEFCNISFHLISGDSRLEFIRVKRGCFDSFTVRKMIKIFKKSK